VPDDMDCEQIILSLGTFRPTVDGRSMQIAEQRMQAENGSKDVFSRLSELCVLLI